MTPATSRVIYDSIDVNHTTTGCKNLQCKGWLCSVTESKFSQLLRILSKELRKEQKMVAAPPVLQFWDYISYSETHTVSIHYRPLSIIGQRQDRRDASLLILKVRILVGLNKG